MHAVLYPYFSAKATTVALPPGLGFGGMWNAASPPPATVTTYCLPLAPWYVSGVISASSSSVALQSSLPVFASNARKPKSVVAPMNTRPLAVAIGPPSLTAVPVPVMPLAVRSLYSPSGVRQAMSPVAMLTATISDQGGALQG